MLAIRPVLDAAAGVKLRVWAGAAGQDPAVAELRRPLPQVTPAQAAQPAVGRGPATCVTSDNSDGMLRKKFYLI